MTENKHRAKTYDDVRAGISGMRRASFLQDLEGESPVNIVDSVEKEIEDLESYFSESVSGAGTISTDLAGEAKSMLTRSSACVCRYLSDFESWMVKHSMQDEAALKGGLEWMIQRLLAVLEKYARALHYSGWSLSVTAGLPAGVSFSITFSFS